MVCDESTCVNLPVAEAGHGHLVGPLRLVESPASVPRTGSTPGTPIVQHPLGSGGGCAGRPERASRALFAQQDAVVPSGLGTTYR
jgi:hypothetical protein